MELQSRYDIADINQFQVHIRKRIYLIKHHAVFRHVKKPSDYSKNIGDILDSLKHGTFKSAYHLNHKIQKCRRKKNITDIVLQVYSHIR